MYSSENTRRAAAIGELDATEISKFSDGFHALTVRPLTCMDWMEDSNSRFPQLVLSHEIWRPGWPSFFVE